MKAALKQRAYRKAITSPGHLYFGEEKREVIVKNISTSGVLVGLKGGYLSADGKHILEELPPHKAINFCIPPLHLFGGAKIARMSTDRHLQIFLGLEFQNLVSCGASAACDNDHAYMSNLVIPGRLVLHSEYFDFLTVSLSEDELVVRLPILVGVEKDMVLACEFPQANLKGWVKVVWAVDMDYFETFVKLEYLKMEDGEDVGKRIGLVLPHAQDCSLTHKLRIFAALKKKPCYGADDK
ncbi:MAG: hypothetical protein PHU14_01650 [Methylovulum sp.]|nr:hypothetical protein [Methylovulum sp.]